MPTFLPIVARELCVAARKRSSYSVRIVAALVAVVLGTGFLILSRVTFGMLPFSPGSGLFGALTWLCFGVTLAAGLFLTSDCLSEEKRAGTMGFLFLTDLRGYDVVCGKLLANSLRGSCAILGVLPILAITLLMGGVTGDQFFKTSLALLNGLFLSLVAGLFVSVLSRESQKALNGTLLLLIALIVLGPISDGILASIRKSAVSPVLSLSSPGYLFLKAGGVGSNPFVLGLIVNQVIGWSLLALTCLLLPRSWQDKPATAAGPGRIAYRWKFGGPKRRARLRATLMDINPVLWLACRERWQAFSVWIMVLAIVTVATAICISVEPSILWMAWGQASGTLTLLLYLLFASQSARFFIEAQHNRVLELLLVTPLTVPQVIQGQWRALRRMLGLPIVLFLAAECVGGFVSQVHAWNRTSASPPPVMMPSNAPPLKSSGTNTTVTLKSGALSGATFSGAGFTLPPRAVLVGIALANTSGLLANFIALVWFGMWMGLISKSLNLATLKTIVFVQIVPWFVVSFAAALMFPLLMMSLLMKGTSPSPQIMMWFPWFVAALSTTLSLLKDLGFSVWARRKLYSEFRMRATQAVVPIRTTAPPFLAAVDRPPRIEPSRETV
jgi:hypothetical protein